MFIERSTDKNRSLQHFILSPTDVFGRSVGYISRKKCWLQCVALLDKFWEKRYSSISTSALLLCGQVGNAIEEWEGKGELNHPTFSVIFIQLFRRFERTNRKHHSFSAMMIAKIPLYTNRVGISAKVAKPGNHTMLPRALLAHCSICTTW